MKRYSLVLLVLGVLIALPPAARAASGSKSVSQSAAFASASGYCADAEEQAFLELINDYRAQNGLAALSLSQTLGAASDFHSVDMATKNYLEHNLADGTTWDQNVHNFGYSYLTSMGENIAGGNAGAAATFTQWKNSSTHNANMLSSNFKAIGIGRAYAAGSQYGWYWTTDFAGVVDSAAKLCSGGSPSSTPATTATATPARTASPAPTMTIAPTKTATPSPTATSTPTKVATQSPTKTATPSRTATISATKTATIAPTKTATIAPTKSSTPSPAATKSPTKTSTPAPAATSVPAATVSISDMSASKATKSGKTTLTISATVKNSAGKLIGGAKVTISIKAPNGSTQSLSATANSKGVASFTYTASAGKGAYKASVTQIAVTGTKYDASRNFVSSVSVSV